jgi:Cu/Ag efflux protein CusF
MRTLTNTIGAALLLATSQLHAQGMNMPMDSKPQAKATASAPPFVNAEVVKVDAAKGSVTLKHDEVPNLKMPGMTMAFAVADKKMLKGVQANDKVRVQFDTVKGKTLVTKLERGK